MYIAVFMRRASKLLQQSQKLTYSSKSSFYLRSIPLRQCSSQATSQNTTSSKGDEKKDKAKIRRAYALGGCLMFMWLSTHALLLYRRRNEHRKLNVQVPPISWDEFVENYLLPGKVKTIVYQPQYEVGNVYLHSVTEQLMKKALLDWIHAAPDKFSRPPDVRFTFEGDATAVKHAVQRLQKLSRDSPKPIAEVEFDVDQFPSSRELAFIVLSTLFTMAAITLVK